MTHTDDTRRYKNTLSTLKLCIIDCSILINTCQLGGIRTIPLHDALVGVLKELPKKSEYVFVTQLGYRLISNSIQMNFRRLRKKSGLKHFSLHSLRHSFASHLIMNGVDLVSVSKLLGHTSIRTTMIYSHLTPKHLVESINKLPF